MTEEDAEGDADDGAEEDTGINLIKLCIALLTACFLYVSGCRDVTGHRNEGYRQRVLLELLEMLLRRQQYFGIRLRYVLSHVA